MSKAAARRFQMPLEVAAPAGAEGWESMYPPYLLFSQENAEWENSLFWYMDALHRPDVEYPFDTIMHEAYMMSVSAWFSRGYAMPGGSGAGSRVLNGRFYLADVPPPEDEDADERMAVFMRRAGHYFENWERLSENWVRKLDAAIAELAAIDVPGLPQLEDEDAVVSGRGLTSAFRLLSAYERTIENLFRVYQYHFEMLLLGYAAQLNFQEFARGAFPGISDHTLANLMAGVDLLQYRPDDELKRLAREAVELGVAERLRADATPQEIVDGMRGDPNGAVWVESFEATKDPWFHVSTGTGLFHNERAWIDDLSVPWAALTGYVDRIERGEVVDRPREQLLARRQALTDEYRALLPTDDDRAAFDQSIGLARLVAPHLQDHNFYIEHRHHTLFWNKMREFGDRLAAAGLLEDRDGLFYLNRWEVGQALFDVANNWSNSGRTRSEHWRSLVTRRREIVGALREWDPEPALGAVPTELGPLLPAQFGITMELVQAWLGRDESRDELRGVGASAGVAEGPARVIDSPQELADVVEGEILVCVATAPAWAPVFGKIGATVSDVGGMMCHAAILCREYGIPAVLGTGSASRQIKTGDVLRVDGQAGIVTVLARAGVS